MKNAVASTNTLPLLSASAVNPHRVDAAKDPIFFKNSDTPVLPTAKSTGTFILAAIVSF